MAENNHKGRVKGSINKRSLNARNVFKQFECDPLVEMITAAQEIFEKSSNPHEKLETAEKLVPYVYPKLKAQEIEHLGNVGLEINVKDYSKLTKEEYEEMQHGGDS